jgi:phospholipid/cholesterol/gamma-HCH transport system permease protein
LGPLLTALLLAGRIGGSFAGEVGTMVATNQNRLLKNLGVSTRMWSLVPSVIAALITAPILTLVGTAIALYAGSIIAEMYGMGTVDDYWDDVYTSCNPENHETWQTYPPYVLAYRSMVFMSITMALAEICGRWDVLLQPRNVPTVITSAVVLSGLFIIFADWGFSQVLIAYSEW